jgi:2,4-dienoyl-CoA reductase-like NADH-dependent reductase (Old Yellow Enzyme family)
LVARVTAGWAAGLADHERELAAAQAAEHAKEIVRAFREALDPSQPIGVRLKAASAWLDVERQEAKDGYAVELEEMEHSELVEFVAVRVLSFVDLAPERHLIPDRADPTGGSAEVGD